MWKFVSAVSLVLILSTCPAWAEPGGEMKAVEPKHKVVIQVSDGDAAKWNLALNNARNIQKALGKPDTDIEIVAFEPAVSLLKAPSSLAARIQDTTAAGIRIAVCENTMAGMGYQKAEMETGVGFVPSGAAEIVLRQQTGYAYLRP